MANSVVCKIVGIGPIKIRTHDGTFCTLNNVRHVPQMTKNLILLRLLDSKGLLSGSPVVASSELIQKEDMTKLWHMRLRHMSERGMRILSKAYLLGGHKVTNLEFCQHCVFGKLNHSKFPKGIHKTKGTLDYIRSDCWDPSRVKSLGGPSLMIFQE
ncbi:uncharacterized mitochondrial protein AtMg00300-like [Beta vulgaris subsp. vulgaris]|uniref:uncharacterized mitochondrial protein AtMg00300-like n=1 Tax=Beta vulgaris subsp. vulgaris TaxID=3555 RepID=UPI000900DA14|nr:uncharacterized mitochondrial protein AtMg00300-like [Beta vulgaris subsp. vulgaris]